MSQFYLGRRVFLGTALLCLSLGMFSVSGLSNAWGQQPETAGLPEKDIAAQLDRATNKIGGEKFQLEYKFRAGEKVFYEIIHQMAVETTVKANTERVKSRTKSLAKWEFQQVAPNGDATFSNTVDYVNMWSEMTGRESQRYDSRTDAEVPDAYQGIANTIGKPLSVVTASKAGQIVNRNDDIKQIDRGTGGLLIPLPAEPVTIGSEWAKPASVKVKFKDGRFKTIKTRQLYRLEKVAAGIATISIDTQVLTPVADAEIKSQLLQKLSKGEMRFDIDAGRLVSKLINWDENVIGFSGAESSMSFLARHTERLVPANEVAELRKPKLR